MIWLSTLLFLVWGASSAAPAGLPAPVAPLSPPTARSVWVSPLILAGSAIWYTEEARVVEDAIAVELGRRGYDVASMARVHAAIDRMHAGLFPDRDGGCAAMSSALAWLEVDHTGYARAATRLDCAPDSPGMGPFGATEPVGCTLSVNVHPPGGTHSPATRLSLSLPAGARAREVARAVPKLAPAAPPAVGGLLGALGVGWVGQRPVHARGVVSSGGWRVTDLVRLDEGLAPLHPPLAVCEEQPAWWLDSTSNPLVLSVDGHGRVTRCEAQAEHHLAPRAECRCVVLRDQLVLPGGAADRRLRFDLDVMPLVRPPSAPTATLDRLVDLTAARADDPTTLLGSDFLLDDPIGACLSTPTPTQRWPMTLEVGPDGRVTSAKADLPLDGGDPTMQACLGAALVGQQRACPHSGRATVQANVLLQAHTRGDPPSDAMEWAKTLGITLPYVAWSGVRPPAGARLVGLLAGGSRRASEATSSGTDADLRVVADATASAADLVALIHAYGGPAVRRVYLQGNHEGAWLRLLVVAPPADTVVVVVPPPTPTGLPLDLPPVAPGEPVRFSFAPGATVGTLAELGSRLDGRDLLLPGGAARP